MTLPLIPGQKLAGFASECNSDEVYHEMTPTADVIVVGAGIIGVTTALALVEHGARVTLVDMHGAGNSLGSSGGESRNIRAAYGDCHLYTRWAVTAWSRWQQREAELGEPLLYACGSLRLLDSETLATQSAVFDRLGQPCEALDGDEIAYRWPQIVMPGDYIFYEPRSGILSAQRALTALAKLFAAKGGRIVKGRVAPPVATAIAHIMVDGMPMAADRFVFACGPWLPRLFPDLLDGWIKTPRRELFFIGPAPNDARFDWCQCPNLVDPLGWTSSDIGGGVKIAPVIRHVAFDPDDGDRMPTPALRDQVRAYLAARLPGLVGRPVVGTHVAPLENSDNEHFILDWHPRHANVFIAGGGSGHAYKLGPVIGDHVAAQVGGAVPDPELVAVFGLAAHGPVPPGKGG